MSEQRLIPNCTADRCDFVIREYRETSNDSGSDDGPRIKQTWIQFQRKVRGKSSAETFRNCKIKRCPKHRINALDELNPIELIQFMNDTFGFSDLPVTMENLNFRLDCILEEVSETRDALNVTHDADEIVDGLVDICVFAIGGLHNAGVDVDKAFREVMRANLTKEIGTAENRPNSGGIDLIKPEGWCQPSHADNLGKLEELFSETS